MAAPRRSRVGSDGARRRVERASTDRCRRQLESRQTARGGDRSLAAGVTRLSDASATRAQRFPIGSRQIENESHRRQAGDDDRESLDGHLRAELLRENPDADHRQRVAREARNLVARGHLGALCGECDVVDEQKQGAEIANTIRRIDQGERRRRGMKSGVSNVLPMNITPRSVAAIRAVARAWLPIDRCIAARRGKARASRMNGMVVAYHLGQKIFVNEEASWSTEALREQDEFGLLQAHRAASGAP